MARTAAQMEIARHEQRRLEAKLGQIRARESYEYFVSETISRNRERNGQVRACVQCVQCVQGVQDVQGAQGAQQGQPGWPCR